MASWGNRNGRGKGNGEEMLAQENQQLTENLASKVSQLKLLAFDMEQDTKDQNKYLSGMDGDFDSTTGLLSGSFKRVSHIISNSKDNRKLMCYLILGLVGLFVLIYYIVMTFRS